jgi:uncharacterized protein (TIGR03435 family)
MAAFGESGDRTRNGSDFRAIMRTNDSPVRLSRKLLSIGVGSVALVVQVARRVEGPPRAFLAVVFALVAVTSPDAQRAPQFEVASIRPTSPGGSSMTVTDTRVAIRSYGLMSLLRIAFGVELFQLSAPAWLDAAKFDIQAVIPSGATRDMVPQMLHQLLIDRFGLVTHIEQRPAPVYELLVDKGGIKMVEVEPADDLTKDFSANPDAKVINDTVDNDVRTMTEFRGQSINLRSVTRQTLYEMTLVNNQTWQLTATRMKMRELASRLRLHTDRPVLDNTGLTGIYQFKIELPVPDLTRVLQNAGATRVNGNPDISDPPRVSVFDAVARLGLRLEPRRSPIDVIVVDKIARTPTDN